MLKERQKKQSKTPSMIKTNPPDESLKLTKESNNMNLTFDKIDIFQTLNSSKLKQAKDSLA